MDYREIDQTEYERRLRLVVVGAEGSHERAQDVGDGRATIGWGYTLNRNNNVAIWRAAGLDLTQEQWQTLAAIDAAPRANRTRIGLTFTRQLNEAESDSLLRASMAEYEAPANALNMPVSDERVAMVSLAYNRGVGNLAGRFRDNVPEHPVMDAIRQGDRAEAWFQMRYNCWGSDRLDRQYPDSGSNEAGLRKRRFAEAGVFGLYDDPNNVTPAEARSVYRAYQLHREEVDRVERAFGVTVEGQEARHNRIEQANRDYPHLVEEYGRISTISDALAPARTALLRDLRQQYPDLADLLTDTNFNTGRIHLDPGRDLQDTASVDLAHPGNNRTQVAVRREQHNTTIEALDPNHPTTLDSRRLQDNVEVATNDLIIGDGGADTLRAHQGDDILVGGEGRDRMEGGQGRDIYVISAGDTVLDSDGIGEVRWGGQRLTGGLRPANDPENVYHSEDGRFTYTLEGSSLAISDNLETDQALRERAIIENFQSGQLGINLTGPARQAFQLPADFRDPAHPGNAVFRRTLGEVHRMEDAKGIPHGLHSEKVAAALLVEAERSKQGISNVEIGSDGRVYGTARFSAFEPEQRVGINPKDAQGQTMEQFAAQWSLARSPHYGSTAPASERTLEQVQALALLLPRDRQMFDKIRDSTPAHISDDVVASALNDAKRGGVGDASRIASIDMIGDRLVVNGTTPGFRGMVDVVQPPPPLQHTLGFNQQQISAQQQEEAQKQQRTQDAPVRMV